MLSNSELGRTEPTLRTVGRLAAALYLRPSDSCNARIWLRGERPR